MTYQNMVPHVHLTGWKSRYWTFILWLHSGLGHHLNNLLHFWREIIENYEAIIIKPTIKKYWIIKTVASEPKASSFGTYFYKTVSYQVLVSKLHFVIRDEIHDCLVINKNVTGMSCTRNFVAHSFFHYFGR